MKDAVRPFDLADLQEAPVFFAAEINRLRGDFIFLAFGIGDIQSDRAVANAIHSVATATGNDA